MLKRCCDLEYRLFSSFDVLCSLSVSLSFSSNSFLFLQPIVTRPSAYLLQTTSCTFILFSHLYSHPYLLSFLSFILSLHFLLPLFLQYPLAAGLPPWATMKTARGSLTRSPFQLSRAIPSLPLPPINTIELSNTYARH